MELLTAVIAISSPLLLLIWPTQVAGMEIEEHKPKCWTENLTDDWYGEIVIPKTCSYSKTTVPIPDIFDHIKNTNTNFTIEIANYINIKPRLNCSDGGSVVLLIPRPGDRKVLTFCQAKHPDRNLTLPFNIQTDNRGIPGGIEINYTSPVQFDDRLEEVRITYSFTENPCLACNNATQKCIETECVQTPEPSCETLADALQCVFIDPCLSSLCKENSTCIPSDDYSSYVCDPCHATSCENGGTCSASEDETPACSCPTNTLGDRCQYINDGTYCLSGIDLYTGSGIRWSDTKLNVTDVQPCPNANGTASRRCNSDDTLTAVWGQPDLSECVSPDFTDIHVAMETLRKSNDVKTESIVNLTTTLHRHITRPTKARLYAGDLSVATDTVRTIADIVHKVNSQESGLNDIAQSFGLAVSSIIDPNTADVWRFSRKGYLEGKLNTILGSVEHISANLASKQESRFKRDLTGQTGASKKMTVSADNIDFSVHVLDRMVPFNEFSFDDDSITLPVDVFSKAAINTVDTFLHLYWARFPFLSELLTDTNNKIQGFTKNAVVPHINSDMVSSKVLNVPEHVFQHLDQTVRLQFQMQNQNESAVLQKRCVYLNMSARSDSHRWLDKGCVLSLTESNSSTTVCYCNHLTNFAVLMDLYDVEDNIDEFNSKVLTYLSYGGGILSIVGCLISVITFEFFKLRNQRVRIHEMLAVTIVIVQLFFLLGIDRTGNRDVCKAMAICLHYFLVAMFCWMLVEGANLYLVLVKVFNSRSHMKKFLVIGWGIPVVVVSISVGIFHDQYGTGNVCWITREVLLVAFVPAVGFVIIINASVLIIVMRIMLKSMSRGSKTTVEERSSVKTGLWASAVLLPLLGLTWTFGFLSITSNETLVFTYLFTLFNSFQGVFFFVFHCLFSVDVRNAYERRSRRRTQKRLSETSSSRRATMKRESEYDSTMYSRASVKTAMTEAQSLRSNRSNVIRPYFNDNKRNSENYQEWQDDSFYDKQSQSTPKHGTVSSKTSRSNVDTGENARKYGGTISGQYENAGFSGDPVLNNTESSEYVMYYGKRSPSSTDLQNYSAFDRNDIYAKPVK